MAGTENSYGEGKKETGWILEMEDLECYLEEFQSGFVVNGSFYVFFFQQIVIKAVSKGKERFYFIIWVVYTYE